MFDRSQGLNITLKAFAKINLGLDIIGKREDGYHLLRMVMQSAGIYDTLEFEITDAPGITLVCDNADIPTDGRNLVCKAVKLIKERYDIREGVSVSLTKRIPSAAGLAGGSADAAATIAAMNTLFDLGLDSATMADIGLELGADIPFCLMGGTALAEGVGEKLTPLDAMPDCAILLVKPECGISTREAYQAIDGAKPSVRPDTDGIVSALKARDLEAVCGSMANVFEPVSIEKHPEIEIIKKKMLDFGAINAMMSGSGPTVFGIFADRDAAQRAFEAIKRSEYGKDVFLTGPVETGIG